MVKFTLDTIPPEMPDYSKMDYELNLFEIIQRSPIPKEDEENNVRISSKWIPKSYDHVVLNIEINDHALIYKQNDGGLRYNKPNRSYIIRCCIHLGHAVFQHNEFVKEYVKEFHNKACNCETFEEQELFYPNNTSYFLDETLLKLNENKNIYITKRVLSWVDSNRQLFNMNRHEMVILLFCLGASIIPDKENIFNKRFIEDMNNIIQLGSTHISKRRLEVETFYKIQELNKNNIFTPEPTKKG